MSCIHGVSKLAKPWLVEECETLISSLLVNTRPPTAHCFLEVFCRSSGVTVYPSVDSYAMFLVDLCLQNNLTCVYLPSTIALCCLRFSIKQVSGYDKSLPTGLILRRLDCAIDRSELSENEAQSCENQIAKLVRDFNHSLEPNPLRENYKQRGISHLLVCRDRFCYLQHPCN